MYMCKVNEYNSRSDFHRCDFMIMYDLGSIGAGLKNDIYKKFR